VLRQNKMRAPDIRTAAGIISHEQHTCGALQVLCWFSMLLWHRGKANPAAQEKIFV
jgi:hypothetical protein